MVLVCFIFRNFAVESSTTILTILDGDIIIATS